MRKAVGVFVSLMAMTAILAAQSGQPAAVSLDEEKGFTALMQFSGTVESSGHVLKLDSTAGYNFNRHFGVDLGVPVYFAGSSSDATTPGISNNAVGNPYIDLRFTFANPTVNYRAAITAYIPTADTSTGLSTGRVTFDWSNRFDHAFSRLEPFLVAGVANSIPDSRLFDRPFTSLGLNAHFEGGASFGLTDHVSVGASLYGILPSGDQKIYSRLGNGHANSPATTVGGSAVGQHGRMFPTTTTMVTTTAETTRDHGFSTWLNVSPNRYLEMEVGYTRSETYDLNGIAFNLGFNIGRLLKDRSRP